MRRTPSAKGTDPSAGQEEDAGPQGPPPVSPNTRADRAERNAEETRNHMDQLVRTMDSWEHKSKERECDYEDQRQHFETLTRAFEEQQAKLERIIAV